VKFKVLTIFPDFFEKSLDFSLLKKAKEKGLIDIEVYNLRDWAKPKEVHKMVDDRPFGGGPGMVMMVEPIYRAINDLKKQIPQQARHGGYNSKTVIFSPKGQKYDQTMAEDFGTNLDELILICPHYEGFDERILNFVDYEISIGDFILTGGEIPALILIDSISRLIPGVLGNEVSNKLESFSDLKKGKKNLEHPQFTRPASFVDDEGRKYDVPEILLSGNHAEIEKWRTENSKFNN